MEKLKKNIQINRLAKLTGDCALVFCTFGGSKFAVRVFVRFFNENVLFPFVDFAQFHFVQFAKRIKLVKQQTMNQTSIEKFFNKTTKGLYNVQNAKVTVLQQNK